MLPNLKNWMIPLVLVMSLVLLFRCGGGGGGNNGGGTTAPPQESFTRAAMLRNLSANVMFQGYNRFASSATDLVSTLDNLSSDPSEAGLTAAREAWLNTAEAYAYVESFHIADIDTLRLGNQVNFWPIRFNTLTQSLNSDAPIDAPYMAELGVGGKGLSTLEYLLFAEEGDQTPLQLLTEPTKGVRRLALVNGIGADLLVNAQRMQQIWDPSGGDLVNQLGEASNGTETYDSFRAALSALVNQMVFMVEFVRNTKVGDPFGILTGGIAQPETVEAPYGSQGSNIKIKANIQALRDMYLGTHGATDDWGLDDYLVFLNSDLDQPVADQFQAALTAIDGLTLPLEQAVTEAPEQVQVLYDALNELVAITKVDMAGEMAVTITFNDNDGD